jgi:hypothetical protein
VSPPKKEPRTGWIPSQFYQTFKNIEKSTTTILLKLFHKVEMEGTLPNLFCESSITLILKSDKDTTIKDYLANIDEKFSIK